MPNAAQERLAERGGFEPPVRIRHSRFPGVRVKPLCHLSTAAPYFARLPLQGKPIHRRVFHSSSMNRDGRSVQLNEIVPGQRIHQSTQVQCNQMRQGIV